MKKSLALFVALSLLLGGIGMVSIFGAEASLTTDKTAYGEDEPILVTAVSEGEKDWVGIYYPGQPHSLRWEYVSTVGSGKPFDIRKTSEVNDGAPETLGPGEYVIRLMPDDSTDISQALAEVEITIGDPSDRPVSGGDLTKLHVPKASYAYNEPILVSAEGAGKDWLGIYYLNDEHSIRWDYVTTIGSGSEVDVRTLSDNGSAPTVLPAGEYVIRLMPDDTSDLSRAIAWVQITIEPPIVDKPGKPLSVSYELADDTDGFAEGILTVKLAEGDSATDVICYWGDDDGRLEGYTAHAKFKVTGSTTVRTIGKNLLIPPGATRLLVYTVNAAGDLSEEYALSLPEGAASKDFGDPLVEFQVVSDIHITGQNTHTYDKNFTGMLKDVVANSKNSAGIFIVGDMANSGKEAEYQQMVKLHQAVTGAPPCFLAVGNHDLYNGTLKDQINLFLKYAHLPDGTNPESSHYDFWLNGYHFVFLGNDRLTNGNLYTTLSAATIEWLDETLAEDRDEGRPTFLFLHQSLYDTISGSFEGQGWNGVANEKPLRDTLKKYPEVVMFNGHSHWTLDSEGTMYVRSEELPTIFSTASVAYLWTSYNIAGGENLDGSQGYYVRVYADKILVLGRDFTTGEWVSSAQFYVDCPGGKGPVTHTVRFDANGQGQAPVSLNVPAGLAASEPTAPTADGYRFDGWYTDAACETRFDFKTLVTDDITLYAKWTKTDASETPNTSGAADTTDTPDTTTPDSEPEKKTPVGLIVGIAAAVAVVAAGAVTLVVLLKKKKGGR